MSARALLSAPCAPSCRPDSGANVIAAHPGLSTPPRSSRHCRGPLRAQGGRVQGEAQRPVTRLCAAQAEAKAASGQVKEEYIEVVLNKPLGLRFTRGADGGVYVTVSDPKLGETDERIEVGDKVMQVSASFGDDVWDAKNFGQVMFAIRTRNGGVFIKVKRMFGDVSQIENIPADNGWKRERNAGNVGSAVREQQRKNYAAKQELGQERLALFNTALGKFGKNDMEGALIDFENVVAMEPRKYIGDNFARYTDIYPVAQYNVACCYSALNQMEAGLEALESALSSGFDDFDKVRSDSNLAALRKDEGFTLLVNKVCNNQFCCM
eukprot:evm.model.scf_823.4 EVM.evm.TU.scf_823.4   scf_823:18991-22323(+)